LKAKPEQTEMSNLTAKQMRLPPQQQAIRDKCFHPTGTFVEFSNEEVEQSIPERFEKIVRRYPDQLAVKMGDCALAYDELNRATNRIARAIMDSRGRSRSLSSCYSSRGFQPSPQSWQC